MANKSTLTAQNILEFLNNGKDVNLALKAFSGLIDNTKTVSGSGKKTEVDIEPDTRKAEEEMESKMTGKPPKNSAIVKVKDTAISEAAPIVDNLIDAFKEMGKSRGQIQKEIEAEAREKNPVTAALIQMQKIEMAKKLEDKKKKAGTPEPTTTTESIDEETLEESKRGAAGQLALRRKAAQEKFETMKQSGRKMKPGDLVHVVRKPTDGKILGQFVVDKKMQGTEYIMKPYEDDEYK